MRLYHLLVSIELHPIMSYAPAFAAPLNLTQSPSIYRTGPSPGGLPGVAGRSADVLETTVLKPEDPVSQLLDTDVVGDDERRPP